MGEENHRESQPPDVRGLRGPRSSVETPNEGDSGSQPSDDLKVSVVRPQDLLVLEFEFVNLTLQTDQSPNLVRKDAGDAFIVVHFPPQSIAEQATVQPEGPPIPIAARMAGESRLVFKVPDSVTQIPYTLAGLLDSVRAGYEQHVAPTALPPNPPAEALSPNAPTIGEPGLQETAIELPYRLILSPNATAGWTHSLEPVTHSGRTELWHTRLGVRKGGQVDEDSAATRTLRAIWSPDFVPPPAPGPQGDSTDPSFPVGTTTSLTPKNRHQIVRLSADFNISSNPAPIQVERLMLTSLGGWMRTRGVWDEPPPGLPPEQRLDLEEWRH